MVTIPSVSSPLVTRRQALSATAVGLGAVATGWFGRFAVGGTFEEHVARTLGLERGAADELLTLLRDALGVDYDARAAGFVAATVSPGSHVLPARTRRKALNAFLGPFFGVEGGNVAPQVYAGLRRPGPFVGCATLVRE